MLSITPGLILPQFLTVALNESGTRETLLDSRHSTSEVRVVLKVT